MSNKNPFEIRAEMLKLAKDYMDQQYSMNVQLMNDMYEQGKKNYEEVMVYGAILGLLLGWRVWHKWTTWQATKRKT